MRFQKVSKNLKFDNLKIFTYQGHQCPKEFHIICKYKDDVFMYNIHIHDEVRVLGIGRNQKQKLCNLRSLIING